MADPTFARSGSLTLPLPKSSSLRATLRALSKLSVRAIANHKALPVELSVKVLRRLSFNDHTYDYAIDILTLITEPPSYTDGYRLQTSPGLEIRPSNFHPRAMSQMISFENVRSSRDLVGFRIEVWSIPPAYENSFFSTCECAMSRCTRCHLDPLPFLILLTSFRL